MKFFAKKGIDGSSKLNAQYFDDMTSLKLKNNAFKSYKMNITTYGR